MAAQARVAHLEAQLAEAREQVALELEARSRAEEIAAAPIATTRAPRAICKLAYLASPQDPTAVSLAVQDRVTVLQTSACGTWALVTVSDQFGHRRGWAPWACLEEDFSPPLPMPPTLLTPAPRSARSDLSEARKLAEPRAPGIGWASTTDRRGGYNDGGLSSGGFSNKGFFRSNDFMQSPYENGTSLYSSDAASKIHDLDDSTPPAEPVARDLFVGRQSARTPLKSRPQFAQTPSCSSCLAGLQAFVKLLGSAAQRSLPRK